MPMESSQDFANEAWSKALGGYATQLSNAFSANLATLSDTGIDLQADDRIEITIDPFNPQQGNRSDFQENRERKATPELLLALNDSNFFEKWQKDAKPLLILAPFGCGKSVLLAHFTCRLAKLLMDWCKKPFGPMPWVPFPIRLRGWQGGVTLEEYSDGVSPSHVHSRAKPL